jgi:hypothetical protein
MINLTLALFMGLCGLALTSSYLKNAHLNKVFLFLSLLALTVFAGFREIGIDQDSFGYLVYYNLDDGRMSLAAEPTFVSIAKISRALSAESGFRLLLITYAVLGVGIKYLAIRKLSNQIWLCLITYFSYYFLLHEVTQIRAGIASGLVLVSIYYAQERKLRTFLALIAVASLFHFSAFVALPIYLLRRNLSAIVKVAVAMAIPLGLFFRISGIDILFVLPIDIVETKIETYTTVGVYALSELNVFNLVYLMKYALLYIFLLFSARIADHSKFFPILLQVYAVSMFCYLAFSFNTTLAMRISELFGVVEIVIIPMLLYAFRSRILGLGAVLLFAILNLGLALYQTELIRIQSV